MTVAVVTKEEYDALVARLAALEARVIAGGVTGGDAGRAYLTPKQVGKRHGVGFQRVYDACANGQLVAERREQGGRVIWRIDPGDAQAWYDAFIRGGDNQ